MTEPNTPCDNAPDHSPALEKLRGREIVLDLQSTFVVLGTLTGKDHRYLILKDADVHDLRDTNTTRDAYVLDASRHGIQPNRKSVLIRHEEIVSISALDDVLV